MQFKDIPLTSTVDDVLAQSTTLGGITVITAAGTAASLTGSYATLDFGTTDPVITIPAAGTYVLWYSANIEGSGATLAAIQTITFKLRRTNNTAADVGNSSAIVRAQVMTLLTSNIGQVSFGPVAYVTANSNDTLALQAIITATPAAGSIVATAASIIALRVK